MSLSECINIIRYHSIIQAISPRDQYSWCFRPWQRNLCLRARAGKILDGCLVVKFHLVWRGRRRLREVFQRDFPRRLPERLAIFIPVAFKDLKAALVFSYKNKKDTVFLVDAVDVGWLVKNLECFFLSPLFIAFFFFFFTDIHLWHQTLVVE